MQAMNVSGAFTQGLIQGGVCVKFCTTAAMSALLKLCVDRAMLCTSSHVLPVFHNQRPTTFWDGFPAHEKLSGTCHVVFIMKLWFYER
jgi:hypothetical protein